MFGEQAVILPRLRVRALAIALALDLVAIAGQTSLAYGFPTMDGKAAAMASRSGHPLGSAADPITEFPIPNSNVDPYDIVTGPDGNLWFTGYSSNTIGRITPAGTIAATFSIPTTNSYPTSIAVGPDGNLWFVESGTNTVARITTAGAITELPFGKCVNDIAAGPDGNLWLAEGARLACSDFIQVITTSGSPFSYLLPPTTGSLPAGIVAGPDGNLWFTESYGNKIGRVTTAGVFTEYAPPTVTSVLGPSSITVGPDGNLWFTEATNQIGRITTAGAITEFPIPAGVLPTDIVAGSDGNLWFTQPLSNEIGRMTTTGAVTEFPVPPASSAPWRLTAGPDGNVWFTEQFGNQIGRIAPTGAITEFELSGQPGGITAGPDGNLWFTELGQIGRMSTAGTFSQLPIPTAGNHSAGIAAGPDGNLWFTESDARKIGQITTAGVPTEFPTGPSPPSAAAAWLSRLNAWRASSNLPPLTENPVWSQGDYLHSIYMVKNKVVTHSEDPSLPYYTVAGDLAARNSNLFCCSEAALTDDGGIDGWMSTVLHGLGMENPQLTSSGFGSYRESTAWPGAEGGGIDVLRGIVRGGGAYPVFFPGPGSTEPLTTYESEVPVDALQSCGYTWPAGEPVYVQVGAPAATTVTAHSFTGNGAPLDHCVLDSHDPAEGSWLASHGAALLIPKQQLQPGVTYEVSMTVNGAPYTWSFGVSADNSISAPNVGPQDVVAGPDGNLWFTEGSANQIGRITPAGAVTEFPLPAANSAPHGITAGPDGNLWFAESLTNRIGRITTAGVITEFPIPTSSSGPHDITAGPDGNLWFTESFSNKIGRITTAGAITEFSVPTAGSQPGGIAAGSDGNLWFTESTESGLGVANIGRITPSGSITEAPTPTAGSAPVDITAGADGNLWFTEQGANQIGRITPAVLPPAVTSVVPNWGPVGGGTVVTITGTNFTGATGVNFGSTAASIFTVNSATSITATSPAGAAGTVDVTVTSPSGTSATRAADQFTYVGPPTVTSVAPNSGPTAGGTRVMITGTNFTGATGVKFGSNAATTFTVNSATSISATSPAGAAGIVDVTVTTPVGASATGAADDFRYASPPTVTSVVPNKGPYVGGTSVAINGTNFTGATAVSFGGMWATTFTVNSATSITATSPAAALGTVDVTVTAPGGTSATSAADQFTYASPPSVTSVVPNTGPSIGGTVVAITGTNFTGATQVSFGATAATTFTVNSATSISATSPAGAAGPVHVTVTAPGGTSATGGPDQFIYIAVSQPTVTSVVPGSGPAPGGTSVTITGANFTGTTAVHFGSSAAAGYTVNSSTKITATSPGGSGIVDVTVTTPSGTSATSPADHFTYNTRAGVAQSGPQPPASRGGVNQSNGAGPGPRIAGSGPLESQPAPATPAGSSGANSAPTLETAPVDSAPAQWVLNIVKALLRAWLLLLR
ncbi:MAG TPA: IPT/TIG domain-containing protein [Candidatus Dormibacteraeota bacterium]